MFHEFYFRNFYRNLQHWLDAVTIAAHADADRFFFLSFSFRCAQAHTKQ